MERRRDYMISKVYIESIRSEALLGSMQSGGSLPELWVPFQRLPEPSMLGEGGPPVWRELDNDMICIFWLHRISRTLDNQRNTRVDYLYHRLVNKCHGVGF